MSPLIFVLLVCIVSGKENQALSTRAQSQPTNPGQPTSPACRKYLAGVNQTLLQCLSEAKSSGTPECSEQDSKETCPSGFYCQNDQCKCLPHPKHVLICNDGSHSASILNCYCMTQGENTSLIHLGACLYNCGNMGNGLHKGDVSVYSVLPTHLNELCEDKNRTGALCGRCIPNYSPLVYSFSWNCVPCPNSKVNWLKYIAAAYLPLTLFCIAILLFEVNLVSSHYHPVVKYCQVIALPVASRIMLDYFSANANSSAIFGVKLVLTLYGIWNLDFFRPFYSDLCLGIDVLPTLALDYAIALYPLFFMIISYLLIGLYDKNYRVITVMWSPFQALLSKFKKNWNIRTSVIDAFATFFFLSNIKFLSVSFDLLIPTKVYQLYQDHYNHTTALYYAADIEYFGREHLPYAILAIVALVLFILVPVIVLILYPFSFFQKILNLFPVRWYILHIFMDSFQGCYKDGTEPGTHDCRWVYSVHFLCHFLLFFMYGATLSMVFFVAASIPLMLLALIIAIVQPFKSSTAHHNLIHAIFAQFLALLCVTIAAANISNYYTHHFYIFIVFSGALILAPLIYSVLLVFYFIFKSRKSIWKVIVKLKARRRGYSELIETSDGNEEVSDRIKNPQGYPKRNMANFS